MLLKLAHSYLGNTNENENQNSNHFTFNKILPVLSLLNTYIILNCEVMVLRVQSFYFQAYHVGRVFRTDLRQRNEIHNFNCDQKFQAEL